MSKIALIANMTSRSSAGWASSEQLVRARKNITIYTLGELPLDTIIKRASEQGCQTIVAAGGDGTISSVVDALVRLHIPARLGILPIGTYNHFAKDLHIPLDIAEALDVIENGKTIQVDVAQVNDRYFINNSSIGLYPYMVQTRLALKRRGISTWVIFLYMFLALCRRQFTFVVSFGRGDNVVLRKTSSIYIGNNKYTYGGFDIGTRARLDEGTLFVGLLKSMHGLEFPRLLYRAFRGIVLQDNDVNVIGLQECTIDSTKKRILVAYDGEVTLMTPPLHYRIVLKALDVIVPII